MVKTPECSICHMKMYVVENRRNTLGYMCPQCDFPVIKNPSNYLKKLREKTIHKLNQKSISGSKPKFGFRRSITSCSQCFQSKYVECIKVRQTKKRDKEGLTPSWKCRCTKCKISWSQNTPKIRMVKHYESQFS